MKKNIILFVLCAVLVGGVFAQQIKASPLEGYWKWDQKGDDYPDFTELLFFGNVMLGTDDDEPVYQGCICTFTDQTIKSADHYFIWQYRLSGNSLSIITDDDERFSYTRVKTPVKSPLEGIWKLTGGQFYEKGSDVRFLFTGNIMAMSEDDDYMGFKVLFKGKYVLPAPELLGYDNENITEKDLNDYGMEYSLSGKNMTINMEGIRLTFTKIY